MVVDFNNKVFTNENHLARGNREVLSLYLRAKRELLEKTKQHGINYNLLLCQLCDKNTLNLLERLCQSEGIEFDYYNPDHDMYYLLEFSIEPKNTLIRKLR